MRERAYREEADRCRVLSDEFHDLPEGSFLLNAANAYEGLADEHVLEAQ